MISFAGYLLESDEESWICRLMDILRSTTPYPAILRSLLDMKYLDDFTDYWGVLASCEIPPRIRAAFALPKYILMYAAGNEGKCSLSSILP